MTSPAADLAARLAAQAEAVCRFYLPAGRRQGRYWIAGDVQGTPGRSLFVKLHGNGAGRWTDAATAQYGDLLDLIGLNRGYGQFRDTLAEARAFLNEPAPARHRKKAPCKEPARDTPAAAEKLTSRSYSPGGGMLAGGSSARD